MPLEGRPTQRRISQQAAPAPPFWKNLVAGGGAGLVEIMCMYPTDVSASLSRLVRCCCWCMYGIHRRVDVTTNENAAAVGSQRGVSAGV